MERPPINSYAAVAALLTNCEELPIANETVLRRAHLVDEYELVYRGQVIVTWRSDGSIRLYRGDEHTRPLGERLSWALPAGWSMSYGRGYYNWQLYHNDLTYVEGGFDLFNPPPEPAKTNRRSYYNSRQTSFYKAVLIWPDGRYRESEY